MKKIILIFVFIISSSNHSYSDEWKLVNKWKISCGIVDKEALKINGKPKKSFNKNEFKVENATFKLDKETSENASQTKDLQEVINILEDKRLPTNYHQAKVFLRPLF